MRATQQDGSYPRPALVRERWASLDGPWDFVFDDADEGRSARWYSPGGKSAASAADPFDRTIEVPFPPESPASGIGERSFHPVVWYRRSLSTDVLDDLQDAARSRVASGNRVLLHFGAVDYRAQVWVNGVLVATHVGGQTPFTADITDALLDDAAHDGAGEHVVVVRAEDDPADLEQPRGKQDWRAEPHGIWYDRTTGIWQSVWLEMVPDQYLVDIAWTPDLAAGVVHGELSLAAAPARPLRLELTLTLGEEVVAEQAVTVASRTTGVDIVIPALRNGQERARLLWTPEHPVLVDVAVVLRERALGGPAAAGDAGAIGATVDAAFSYLGLRSAAVGGGAFRLNEAPYYVRSVLDQGFRPQTHLASTGSAQLRGEVEQMKAMGFNAVRVHQKAEDPRFLYWTDRLGLLVWGETAAAYAFSPTAVQLLTAEWMELVRRDRSHPSIVTWVPVNESWGVQDIAVNPAQQRYALALANLTRALDPSRPVISNDGWEHVDSDILGLHDYTTDPEVFGARYATADSVRALVTSAHGPQGRRPMLTDGQYQAFVEGRAPLMITEFGGVSLSDDKGAWGYEHVGSDSEYASLLLHLFGALHSSSEVAGFCYTQFMDTGQETNGLLYADGRPKIAVEDIRSIVTGVKDASQLTQTSTFGWTH